MPDAQIHPIGVAQVPADYTLPSSAEVLLKGVFAAFDGSGAASAYQPMFRLISDAGTVALESVADVTVAAGGSADASWFPHVGAGAASSATTAPVLAYGTNFNAQTVTHGTTANSAFTSVHSSDTSQLSWSTSVATNDTLTIHGLGFAMLTAGCRWTAGTKIDYRIHSPDGYEVFPHDGFDSMSGYGDGTPLGLATLMDVSWIDNTANPTMPLRVQMTNSDGADSGPDLSYIGCIFYPGLV